MTRQEYILSKKLGFEGLVDPEKEVDSAFAEHVNAIVKALDEFEYLYLDVGPDEYIN